MAWNDSGNGKDPWGRGGGQEGPPDLDKIVRDWQRKFSALFGGGKRRGGNADNMAPLVGLLVLLLVPQHCCGATFQTAAIDKFVMLLPTLPKI